MQARVLKEFSTPLHRFRVGDLVPDESMIDGAVDMQTWINNGFLVPGSAELFVPEEPVAAVAVAPPDRRVEPGEMVMEPPPDAVAPVKAKK